MVLRTRPVNQRFITTQICRKRAILGGVSGLRLLNYVNFDNKVFTRGEAYLILSNLLDFKKEGEGFGISGIAEFKKIK